MNRLIDWSYVQREPLSWGLTLGVAGLVWLSFQSLSWKRNPVVDEAPLQLRLELPVFQAQPEKTPALKPQPKPVAPARTQSQSLAEPVSKERDWTPSALDQASVQSHFSGATEAKPVQAGPDTKPTAVSSNHPRPVSTDSVYAAELLAYLEKIKRYPTSREARLSRPQGTVVLWLELDRQGSLKATGLVDSSGSNLLDSEALKTVKSGVYPSMSSDAFAQESSHRFVVHLKYEVK